MFASTCTCTDHAYAVLVVLSTYEEWWRGAELRSEVRSSSAGSTTSSTVEPLALSRGGGGEGKVLLNCCEL